MVEAISVTDVLRKARTLLDTTTRGLALATGSDADARPAGVQIVAVFGRSVTLVLQNLRTVVGDEPFDDWYRPYREGLKTDPLCEWFKRLRNEILKEGPEEVGSTLLTTYRDVGDPWDEWKPPPPDSTALTLHEGRFHWRITRPDGTEELEEASTFAELASYSFPSLAGQPNPTVSIGSLCEEYVAKLRLVVEEAERHFGS